MDEPPTESTSLDDEPLTESTSLDEAERELARILRELGGESPDESPPVGPPPVPRELIDYPMSREDLLVLARDWVTFIHQEEEMWFLDGQSSSGRRARFAHEELKRLAEVLGDDPIKEVWEKASLQRRRRFGEKLWAIYEDGTQEERDQVVADGYGNVNYQESKLANVSLKERAMAHLRANPNGLFIDEDQDIWSLVDATLPADGEEEQLTLMLMTRSRGYELDPTSQIARPSGWVTPTWCRRCWKS